MLLILILNILNGQKSSKFVIMVKNKIIHLTIINLLSASQHHVWIFPLLPERQQKLRTPIVYNGLPKFLGKLLYAYLLWELMNSVGSHGSSSLSFVMKVMVCHFVSDSHEVMTALIVVLPLIVVVEITL
jgi:hypothetical protein